MKKNIFYLFVFITAISCKSYLVNGYFSKLGVFEDTVKIEKFMNNEKEVFFLHMHHIGTTKFYENVKFKLDSIKNLGYIVYYETMTSSTFKNFSNMKEAEEKDSILLYKFRKVFGSELMSRKGKTDFMEVLKNNGIKLKKNLVNQPSVKDFNLSDSDKNVDATIENLLIEYERVYGKITLEPCDFKTKYDTKSECNNRIEKNTFDQLILNYRNSIVINEIQKSTSKKIIILYGTSHFIGIKDSLQKLGYTLTNH